MLFKNIFVFMMMFCVSIPANASCNFSEDIKELEDGTYNYSRDCHIEVGKRVKRLILVDQQIMELEKTIELKDLALTKQKERADMWMDSSLQISDKLKTYNKIDNKENTLYFALGVGLAILSVWGAGQLVR